MPYYAIEKGRKEGAAVKIQSLVHHSTRLQVQGIQSIVLAELIIQVAQNSSAVQQQPRIFQSATK